MRCPARVRIQYTRYPHMGEHSGFMQFARHLDHARFQVGLHAASDSDADLPLPWEGLRSRLRARVQRGGMQWYKLSDLNAELRAAGEALVGATDLVHALDGEHAVQFLPRWLRAMPGRRTRLVATYHQPPAVLSEVVDSRILPQLDCVTLVSPSQVSFFSRHVPPERLRVILHGIDAGFFVPGSPRGRVDGAFRCVTAGHWLRDWHAFEAVAEALSNRREFRFEAVTSRQLAASRLPNVLVHRNIDDEALRRTYQQADVLFLPLTDSTANNALLEGMACGLPVVSTDLAAVRAYVGEDGAILVRPGATADYVAALLALRADESRRCTLGQRSRLRAEQLDWCRVAPSYEALYQELLDA